MLDVFVEPNSLPEGSPVAFHANRQPRFLRLPGPQFG